MARRKSRLARTESKRAVRSTFTYIVLTIVLIAALFGFGIPLINTVTSVVIGFFGDETQVVQVDGSPIAPPRLDSLNEFVNERKVKISGSSSPGFTVIVHINETSKELIADADGNFVTTHNLAEGENEIYATAKSGNTVSHRSRAFNVTLDEEAPEVEIISPKDGDSFYGSNDRQQKIQGQTEPGARVTINERFVIVRSDGKFDLTTSLEEGENEFKILVRDEAGNETETTMKLNFSL